MIADKIKDRIQGLRGKIGVHYTDLQSQESCFVGNSDEFVAAGIAMLPVLIEAFAQINGGKLSKTGIYRLSDQDKVPSIGVLRCLHAGLELTVEDLYMTMISICDNTAYNVLTDIVGLDNVNATMESLGFYKTKVLRKFYDYKKMKQGVENTFSLQETAEIFSRLYNGQLISTTASAEILEVLKGQQQNFLIPHNFGRSIPIAHLTGEDEGTVHDVGIVFSKYPFIVCLAANDSNVMSAEEAMRDVVFMCYQNSMKYN